MFCTVFFPNNDISPSRRLRIQRAREYGASWMIDWTENITHVVVDKDLQYSDLVKYLKLETFPVSPLRPCLRQHLLNMAIGKCGSCQRVISFRLHQISLRFESSPSAISCGRSASIWAERCPGSNNRVSRSGLTATEKAEKRPGTDTGAIAVPG